MAALSDLFTGVDGTDIASHAANTGESWTYHPQSVASPSVVIASNRARANKSGDNMVYSSWTPASADYFVEADLVVQTVAASTIAGVFGRSDTVAKTNYWFGYQVSDGKWHIFKNVAGVFTDLGTAVAQTLSAGSSYHIRLDMSGTTIRGYVDGILTVFATDAGIAAAGKAGFWVQGALSNSTGIHVDNLTASDPVSTTTLLTNDANLFWSPGSWFTSGTTYKQATNPGSYLKFAVTGSATIGLAIDFSPLTGGGISTADYPKVAFSINGGLLTTAQPLASPYTIAAGLVTGNTYTVEVWFIASKQTNDRWTTPTNALRITGIVVDTGGSTASLSGTNLALKTKRALFYGDSITEGVCALGTSNGDLSSNDARQTWCRYVANALDCEYGQVGFGFQGMRHVGNGNVPILNTSYPLYFTGQARTMSGFDYVFVNMGTNDTTSNGALLTQADVTTFLTNLRASVGASTLIFMVIPFGQINVTTLAAAITTAQGSDSKLYKIDLGAAESRGLTAQGAATWAGIDGLHPNPEAQGRLGALVAQKVQLVLTPYATQSGGGSGGGGRLGLGL